MQNISVAIASYNKLQQLRKVLGTLIPRLTENDQLIIVDDGSSDGSQDYIQNLDILPDYDYYLQANKGYRLSTARNRGIELANNDCIVQIDDDYAMTGNIISKARELYSKDSFVIFRRDETDLETRKIIRDERLGFNWKKRKVGSNLFEFIPTNNPPRINAIWGMVIYSKEMAEYVGDYSEAYNGRWGAEDCDFGTRFLYAGCKILYYIGERCIHLDHEKRENRKNEKLENVEIMNEKLREYRKLKKFREY